MPAFLASTARKLCWIAFVINMIGVTFVALTALAGLNEQALAWSPFPDPRPSGSHDSGSLANLALQKVLADAAPVFGAYENARTDAASWMSSCPDSTPIVDLNLLGTHDSVTWNYSTTTQKSLAHVTELVMDPLIDPDFFRCQDQSISTMLNSGFRVFDLRYAYDVTNSSLTFWHGPGLMSETATLDDVLFGFYRWLDDHPSEAIFLSFQYEGSTTRYASNDAGVQMLLYRALTTPAARKYFVQTKGALGTLGEARGKATLFRRFDLDQLPQSFTDDLPGLHFSPVNWTDNSPNIELVYNTTSGAVAYIEDYYQPLTPRGSSAAYNIQTKVNATLAHLDLAASTHLDSLFWTFASSTNLLNSPPDTPRIQALGNGSDTPSGGVNQQLVQYLQEMKGKRLGILMLDFFEQPNELVEAFRNL